MMLYIAFKNDKKKILLTKFEAAILIANKTTNVLSSLINLRIDLIYLNKDNIIYYSIIIITM